MTVRPWTQAVLAATLAALTALAAWEWFRPQPTLDPIVESLQQGRLDDAEAQLRRILSREPRNANAHLLFAQTALARLDALDHPQPDLVRDALAHARQVQNADGTLEEQARLVEGKLCYRVNRFDEAEAAWKEARARDETSEAGWLLLHLYELQDRSRPRRALALRLYRVNPGPNEKRRALIELIRQDVHHQAAASAIRLLAPVVEANPADLQSVLALGRALAHEGRGKEGIQRLQSAVEEHPANLEAWDALLTALEDDGQVETQARTLALVPRSEAEGALLARHEGWLAQERGDWKSAASAYRRALGTDPDDVRVGYQLSRVLKRAGDQEEADRAEQGFRNHDEARKELRILYEQNQKELRGSHPGAELRQQVAALRERMGRRVEARAWHALVLLDDPGNPLSVAAVERLK